MQSTKCSCSRFRGCGRNGKNNIQTTGKAIQLRLHASDFYLSIWTCWNTELQRVQVNQCQFCVLKPEKNFRPSFGLLGSLQRAIPFYIHTPPMEEVSQNLPLRNQRSKVPTHAPLQKLPKFSFPLRKKPIFSQTPRKY